VRTSINNFQLWFRVCVLVIPFPDPKLPQADLLFHNISSWIFWFLSYPATIPMSLKAYLHKNLEQVLFLSMFIYTLNQTQTSHMSCQNSFAVKEFLQHILVHVWPLCIRCMNYAIIHTKNRNLVSEMHTYTVECLTSRFSVLCPAQTRA